MRTLMDKRNTLKTQLEFLTLAQNLMSNGAIACFFSGLVYILLEGAATMAFAYGLMFVVATALFIPFILIVTFEKLAVQEALDKLNDNGDAS